MLLPEVIKVEPYWNVKVCFISEDSPIKEIKVESYWNVNIVYMTQVHRSPIIKVEPYWNVNNNPLKYTLVA